MCWKFIRSSSGICRTGGVTRVVERESKHELPILCSSTEEMNFLSQHVTLVSH